MTSVADKMNFGLRKNTEDWKCSRNEAHTHLKVLKTTILKCDWIFV